MLPRTGISIAVLIALALILLGTGWLLRDRDRGSRSQAG